MCINIIPDTARGAVFFIMWVSTLFWSPWRNNDYYKGFTPETRKRPRADAVKSTHLKPSCHRTGTTTVPYPKPECDLRYQRIRLLAPSRATSFNTSRRKHSPTKRNPVACPRDGPGLSAHWPHCPGTNPPIYPSSLPLACGNLLLSNIFPKSHGLRPDLRAHLHITF
jgi:hypothetical protein